METIVPAQKIESKRTRQYNPIAISRASANLVNTIDSLRYWARSPTLCGTRHKLIAMFEAYFDESGIHDSAQVCVLAGYLAPEKEWRRFAPKWADVLATEQIEVFHATKCNAYEGEFAKLKGDAERRDKLVVDLCATIATRHRIVPFLTGIIVDEYSDGFRAKIGIDAKHPYYLGMLAVLTQIGHWMNLASYPASEQVKLIFDRQKQFSKYATILFNQAIDGPYWEGQERFRGISFESKADFIPLQAADAIAFDSYHEFQRRYYRSDKRMRRSFEILSKGVPGFVWDTEQIKKITEGA